MQGWKLALACRHRAGKCCVGLVKFPITSIQIMGFGSRLWDLSVLVDKKVSFHTCKCMFMIIYAWLFGNVSYPFIQLP